MFKEITLAVLLILTPIIVVLAQPVGDYDRGAPEEILGGSEAARALARLGDLSPVALRDRLKQMRPPVNSLAPASVEKIIESQHLPIVESKGVDQLKAALQPVLNYHDRGWMPIFVLRSEQPKASLVDRAVMIITTRMMVISNVQEIQGIIAHELSHEYVWNVRFEASKEKNGKRMREVELFCDAAAAFTLKEIGADPASYGRILERLTVIGVNAGSATMRETSSHPSLDARIRLNQFLCDRFK
jgi:hypothetical protein